jgi:hypothetical protein
MRRRTRSNSFLCQPTYRPPRLRRLGRTARAIRGAWSYSYTDRGADFYKYGE